MVRNRLLLFAFAIIWGTAVSTSAQEVAGTTTTTPVGFQFDVNVSNVVRAAANDCAPLQASARQVGATLTCDATSRMPAWDLNATMTLYKFVGIKVGFLDVGQVRVRANAAAESVTDAFVIGSTFAQDSVFGRARGVTLLGVARLPMRRVVPFVEAGVWHWSATTASHTQVGNTVNAVPTLVDVHDASGTVQNWDPVVGGGVEIWLSKYLALDAGVRSIVLSTSTDLVHQRFTSMSFGIKAGRR